MVVRAALLRYGSVVMVGDLSGLPTRLSGHTGRPVLYSAPHVADDHDRKDANDEHLARALSLIVSPTI
jgi:hypothetical protein